MSHQNYQAFEKNTANYVPLTPLSFLKRTATLYPNIPSIVYAGRQFTWSETEQRCQQFAHILKQRGIGLGDTVSILSPNTPALIEAQFSVPMVGAVINTINIRLDVGNVAYILKHADSKLVLVDAQFVPLLKKAFDRSALQLEVIVINDIDAGFECHEYEEYEQLLTQFGRDYGSGSDRTQTSIDLDQQPLDEWQALALNYTSGTSGHPKGVVYHHRGSYLMSMGSIIAWQIPMHPKYLYTVPLFHCNGWGYVWTMCLMAGTLYCIRQISATEVFRLIEEHKIDHFGGAPIVLSLLVNADETDKKIFNHQVKVMTAGAPPPPTVLRQMQAMNFEVMQVYGLTETYGHISHCLWKQKWNQLSAEEQAEIKSWQGMAYPMTEAIALIDKETQQAIPPHQTGREGEICIRGNTVMKGYYKDPQATEKTFVNGWLHSGDIAEWQDIGYLRMKDRLKDVIISGGENISSVEVEKILYKHPSIAHVAVIAKADEKWGEVPAAFIELKDQYDQPTPEELISLCREHLSGFKVPKHFYFQELPKTATGKIQKFLLRNAIADC